jgi:hypothetical protein
MAWPRWPKRLDRETHRQVSRAGAVDRIRRRRGTGRARVLADPDNRLRVVAYGWFAVHPDPAVLQTLLSALDTSGSSSCVRC